MTKLPKIFHNDFTKNITNNKVYSYASNNTLKIDKQKIINFIDELYNEDGFIFNKPIIIKTNKKIYNTAIIKREDNYIYTLTDDIININDILSIERK